MNTVERNTMFTSLYKETSKVKVFDAYDFYKRNYFNEKSHFGIAVWNMNNVETNSESRMVNFLPLYEKDREAFDDITLTAIDMGIKPVMKEVLQLPTIPWVWVMGIHSLGGFYRVFDIEYDDPKIYDIIRHFDKHLEVPDDFIPIYLNIYSKGYEVVGNNMTEKDLYIEFRREMKLGELKHFQFSKAIYLSELHTTDANTIIRKISDTDCHTVIVDVLNLEEPLSEDKAAELVKVASRYGISLDFSKETEQYGSAVYRKVFRMMYDFTSVESLDNSLTSEVSKYGNNFYFTEDFRTWYPVKLYKENGKWFIKQRQSNRGLGEEISNLEIDLLKGNGLNKLTDTLYEVDLPCWLYDSYPNGLVSSIYVSEEDDNSPMPKQLMERGNWIGG